MRVRVEHIFARKAQMGVRVFSESSFVQMLSGCLSACRWMV